MTKLAAVFDLDGTLLDTIDDLAYAVNTALQEHGFPTHPREAYFYFCLLYTSPPVRRALKPHENAAAYGYCLFARRPRYLRRGDRVSV